MTRVQLLQSVICSTFIMFLVSGCSGTSAVEPQPGATFSGPMEISSSGMGSNVTVDGGEIEFTVTEDGAAIASITYNLINAVCTNVEKNTRVGSASYSVSSNPPTPIINGNFEFEGTDIIIKGNFTSATEANGTFEYIVFEMETLDTGNYFTCDFGTWNWSAIVK